RMPDRAEEPTELIVRLRSKLRDSLPAAFARASPTDQNARRSLPDRARASLWRSLSFGLLLATRFLLKPRSANRESRGLPARSPGPCGASEPSGAGRGDA